MTRTRFGSLTVSPLESVCPAAMSILETLGAKGSNREFTTSRSELKSEMAPIAHRGAPSKGRSSHESAARIRQADEDMKFHEPIDCPILSKIQIVLLVLAIVVYLVEDLIEPENPESHEAPKPKRWRSAIKLLARQLGPRAPPPFEGRTQHVSRLNPAGPAKV